MTGELLHTYTRKKLAAMARRRRVSGWHDMRKADLIKVLLDDAQQPDRLDPAAESSAEGDRTSSLYEPALSDKPSPPETSRRVVSPALLRTVDRDEDHFSAAAISPHWVRAEWAVTRELLRRAERALGPARHTAQPVLRLYELSDDERLTHAVTFVSDTPVPADVREWFVQVDQPGGVYQLQLGIRADDGEFHRLLSSDRINTGEPVDSSSLTRGRHALPKSWRISREMNGGVRQNGLPLLIDVELVIRGRTDPQANVAIAEDTIPLESDGSFKHSLPLVEGRQVIPTTVVSPQQSSRRTVVVAIQRHTRPLEPQGPDDH